MEKWKVVIIILLIGALGGYGAYQSVSSNPPTGAQIPAPAPGKPGKPQKNLVGKPLPTWNIPAKYWINTPKPVTPADLKGSVAIVEFFRIECSHCQAAAPVMKEIYDDFSTRGLKMVSIQAPAPQITEENDWNQVQDTVNSWEFKHPVAFDEGSKNFRGSGFNGQSYPSIYIIDKQGIVRYQQTGHDDKKTEAIKAMLNKLLP